MDSKMTDDFPDTDLCKLSIDGCVANVTMARSEVYNALNIQLISELIEIIEWTTQRSVGFTESLNDSSGNPYLRAFVLGGDCLLYTSPSPRDLSTSRMPSSA